MNLSLEQVQGALLLVPQFTLAADTRSGLAARILDRRPARSGPARCSKGWCKRRASGTPRVETGVFGAHMQVSLTNDGPVTFWLES